MRGLRWDAVTRKCSGRGFGGVVWWVGWGVWSEMSCSCRLNDTVVVELHGVEVPKGLSFVIG